MDQVVIEAGNIERSNSDSFSWWQTHKLGDAILSNDNSKMIQALNNGANPNGNLDDILLWIQYSNWQDYSYLTYSIMDNKYEIAEFLITKGADINSKYNGYTALYVACENKNYKAIDFLLNKGADPNIRGYFNITALHLIADWEPNSANFDAEKQLFYVKALLSHNVANQMINALTRRSKVSALDRAIVHENSPLCQMLLDHGATLTPLSISLLKDHKLTTDLARNILTLDKRIDISHFHKETAIKILEENNTLLEKNNALLSEQLMLLSTATLIMPEPEDHYIEEMMNNSKNKEMTFSYDQSVKAPKSDTDLESLKISTSNDDYSDKEFVMDMDL